MPNYYRTGYVADAQEGAGLDFQKANDGGWKLFYLPAPRALELATLDATSQRTPVLLAEGDREAKVVVTYPLNTSATGGRFLEPKFECLRTITFERVLTTFDVDAEDMPHLFGGLPKGFVRDPYFGFGTEAGLFYLTAAIERIDGVTNLKVVGGRHDRQPTVEGDSYVISRSAFDRVRRAVNRAHRRALTIAGVEKRVFVHNALLTPVDPQKYPEHATPYRKNAVAAAIGDGLNAAGVLSGPDQRVVTAAARQSVRSLVKTNPTEIYELAREIELVSLEGLITAMRAKLDANIGEKQWQAFFVANPFVIRLAFGHPVVMIQDEFYVGGTTVQRTGGKLSDFAVKAAASGNVALVEIKKPSAPLLSPREYRTGLHAPSEDLAGAVNQVLDQRYELQRSIDPLKVRSRLYDLETFAVQGLVVAGRDPGTDAHKKSFELFRNSLKSVTVVTYDELLAKLEDLLALLSAGPGQTLAAGAPTNVNSATPISPEPSGS